MALYKRRICDHIFHSSSVILYIGAGFLSLNENVCTSLRPRRTLNQSQKYPVHLILVFFLNFFVLFAEHAAYYVFS